MVAAQWCSRGPGAALLRSAHAARPALLAAPGVRAPQAARTSATRSSSPPGAASASWPTSAGGRVRLVDVDGEDLAGNHPEIVGELVARALAETLVVDGYLTVQALRSGVGVVLDVDDSPASASTSPSSSSAAGPPTTSGTAARPRDRAPAGAVVRPTPSAEPDAPTIAFVAVDLLALDDQPLLDVPLLERKRLLESVLPEGARVRRTPFVREPAGTFIIDVALGSASAASPTRSANSRYVPGAPQRRLVADRRCRAAEPRGVAAARRPRRSGRRPAPAPRRSAARTAARGRVRRCRHRADAGDPRRDRPPRPGRPRGRDPELQERDDDRPRHPRRAGRPRPVLRRPAAAPRQLRRRLARRDPARRRRDRAARLRRADPPRPAHEPPRAPDPHLPRGRRRRRQGRRPAHDLRDRGRPRRPRPRRRRLRPPLDHARVDRAPRRADPQGRLRLRDARSTPATSTTARSRTPSPTR